jgi:apolipoprotein D and lipocalin family protein
MTRLIPGATLALGLLAAGAVWAAPTDNVVSQQPLDTDKIMGRWYEILRAPNKLQTNCFAAYQVWTRRAGDAYDIQQVCHRDSPEGRVDDVTVVARPLNPQKTLYDTSFFGGLIHAKYAVTDHAADYSWLIATTADGRFPKLLARAPGLPAAQQEAIKQRMAQLGFDVARLVPCSEPTS